MLCFDLAVRADSFEPPRVPAAKALLLMTLSTNNMN